MAVITVRHCRDFARPALWFGTDPLSTSHRRDDGKQPDEPYGPLVVCGLIFVAVLLNFILRIKNRYVCVSLSSFWFLSLSPSLSPAGDGRQSSSSFRPLAAFFSFASRGSLVCAVRRRNSKKEDTRKSKTDQGTAYRYCREQLRDQPSPKNPWLTSVEMVKVAFNLQEPASPL